MRVAGKIHSRNPLQSPQLKKMLDLLASRGEVGATTWELANVSGSLNVATCMSECRAGGFNIVCEREEGKRTYRYWMKEHVYEK